MRKKVSKKERIFQIVNTVLVVGILCFYFGRLFYYKNKMAVVYTETSYAALSNVIVDRNDLVAEERLYENKDGSYYFKGNVENNYVNFCGQLFRVVSIDKDGNIKAISNDSVGIALLNGNDSFEKTPLNKWLNEDGFYKSVDDGSSMLLNSKFNYSKVSDVKDIPTDNVYEAQIGLLTLDEYVQAGGANSFLNFKDSYWLGNTDASGKYYFIDETGAIGTTYSERLMVNVRPVISISFAMKALSGNGTIDDPYILNENTVETAANLPSGSYVSYGDYLWRASYINDVGNAVLIMADAIKENDEYTMFIFGSDCNYTIDSGIGRKLNKMSFVDENYLVENDWYVGAVEEDLDYSGVYEETYKAYVGLPSLADMYLNADSSFYLSTKMANSNYMIYTIKENILYNGLTTDEAGVKAMVALKGEIKIAGGTGSASDPYTLEVIAHE